MSGGFWAGAVPPWAWPVGGCLGILLVLLGAWYGYGRGRKHAEEEQRWAEEQDAAEAIAIFETARREGRLGRTAPPETREQAKARRTHPVYRHHVLSECPDEDSCPVHGRAQVPPEWAHEDQALTIANEPCHPECFGPRCRCHRKTDDYLAYHRGEWPAPPAITTGEIQAITDETDAMVARWKADNDLWMAEHGLSGGEA